MCPMQRQPCEKVGYVVETGVKRFQEEDSIIL